MHLGCMTTFTRERLADRTIVRCPACKFEYVSIDDMALKARQDAEDAVWDLRFPKPVVVKKVPKPRAKKKK